MEERMQAKAVAHEAHVKAVDHRQQVEARAGGPPAAPKTAALPPGGHTSATLNQHSSAVQGSATVNGSANAGKGPSGTVAGPGPHPGGPQPHPGVSNPNNQHAPQPVHPPQKDQHPPQKDSQQKGGSQQ
jgi:hypothetical protein